MLMLLSRLRLGRSWVSARRLHAADLELVHLCVHETRVAAPEWMTSEYLHTTPQRGAGSVVPDLQAGTLMLTSRRCWRRRPRASLSLLLSLLQVTNGDAPAAGLDEAVLCPVIKPGVCDSGLGRERQVQINRSYERANAYVTQSRLHCVIMLPFAAASVKSC